MMRRAGWRWGKSAPNPFGSGGFIDVLWDPIDVLFGSYVYPFYDVLDLGELRCLVLGVYKWN